MTTLASPPSTKNRDKSQHDATLTDVAAIVIQEQEQRPDGHQEPAAIAGADQEGEIHRQQDDAETPEPAGLHHVMDQDQRLDHQVFGRNPDRIEMARPGAGPRGSGAGSAP